MKEKTEQERRGVDRISKITVSEGLRLYADQIESGKVSLIDFSQDLEFDDSVHGVDGQSERISFTMFTPLDK